jgi:hypothetical protein
LGIAKLPFQNQVDLRTAACAVMKGFDVNTRILKAASLPNFSFLQRVT